MPPAVLVGAGPVGLAAARAFVEAELGSVDWVVDPDDARRSSAANELGASACASVEELPSAAKHVAILAFSSRRDLVAAVITQLLERGYSVVTTCEELADPTRSQRDELHRRAEAAGAVVIATGANPGFVMDRLPLLVAGGCRQIREVRVTRHLDTGQRRAPLVAKTGKGLTPEAFEAGAASGEIGHVGLEASLRLLAEGLGWDSGGLTTAIEPVLDPEGLVAGLRQVARLDAASGVIHYELVMSSLVTEPVDLVQVDGIPPLEVRIPSGYHGDLGTTARVVNALRSAGQLDPGFYRPTDLPVNG